ncbi:monocarboxylate permease [Fusarium heterosporum]|uniref:Monocarboxylate permease n=1 Tax=Fusarium heterosporum TaxID=42747 RepID=A0A8H5SY88_FUSHE|nr:monocarboxylate permease [Fusarium heterosporum]
MHQDQQKRLFRARIIASVAATTLSLACGTNYVYSAWAPQFAERLKLSSTESNLIGLSGNLGMYTLGMPIGIFVDHHGPRFAVLGGAILMLLGYFPLHQAYQRASGSVMLLCVFSYMTGLGGCMAFAAAVKTSALNWPKHRGSATAFPLAAFGLSAFFFSFLGAVFFPGDPSAFLELLAWGTFGLTFGSFFFLRVHHEQLEYEAVPVMDEAVVIPSTEPPQSRPGSSDEPKPYRSTRAEVEPVSIAPSTAAAGPDPTGSPGIPFAPEFGLVVAPENPEDLEVGETSPLISRTSSRVEQPLLGNHDINGHGPHLVDIRGLALVRSISFWHLFVIMGILAGVGLMTIKYDCLLSNLEKFSADRVSSNIGNDAKALWKHYDKNVTDDTLVHRQQMHVSTLSVCSFLGRLSSGVGSDFLVNKLHASRLWCLVIACAVFIFAQVCALNIEDPHLLGLVSGPSGLAYGFLFGVSPSLVAETFGVRGMSQNWGFLTMAPVISSNIFNIFYGKIYDQHSIVGPGGERSCIDGLECYRSAYWVTLISCCAGTGLTLWAIRHRHAKALRAMNKGDEED